MSLAAEKRRKAKALEEAGASLSVKLISRSTRGRRVTELKGEDAEADETFWGQGAWQVDDDSDFSTEEEESDKFDDDFNESESEDEDDGLEETTLRKNERTAKRKRPKGGGVYKEPKRHTGPKAKKQVTPPKAEGGEVVSSGTSQAVVGEEEEEGEGEEGEEGRKASSLSARIGEQDYAPIHRSVRASTKNKTERSFKEREGEAKAREALLKRATPQPKKLKGQFTQEQMLAEAIQTEQENMRWILKQQRLEDEAKEDEARPKIHKALASRWVSRRGCIDAIFFPDASSLPLVLCQPPADPDAEQSNTPAVCKITGAPAKYRDPLTGFPYADSAAFKELRRKFGHPIRRRKAGQQERDVKDVENNTGAGPAGSGSTSGQGDNGAGAGSGDGGIATSSAVVAAGAPGTSTAKPAAGDHAGGGHTSSGQGKKQSASKDTEKKSKSSSGKGKSKAGGKGSSKGASPSSSSSSKASSPSSTKAPAASSSSKGSTSPSSSKTTVASKSEPSQTASDGVEGAGTDPGASVAGDGKADGGTTRVKTEAKEKQGPKRPRKSAGSAKGAKPARRPFFAPAPSATTGAPAAGTSPPAADSMVALGPVKASRRDETWVANNAGVSNTHGAVPSGQGSYSTTHGAGVEPTPSGAEATAPPLSRHSQNSTVSMRQSPDVAVGAEELSGASAAGTSNSSRRPDEDGANAEVGKGWRDDASPNEDGYPDWQQTLPSSEHSPG